MNRRLKILLAVVVFFVVMSFVTVISAQHDLLWVPLAVLVYCLMMTFVLRWNHIARGRYSSGPGIPPPRPWPDVNDEEEEQGCLPFPPRPEYYQEGLFPPSPKKGA